MYTGSSSGVGRGWGIRTQILGWVLIEAIPRIGIVQGSGWVGCSINSGPEDGEGSNGWRRYYTRTAR